MIVSKETAFFSRKFLILKLFTDSFFRMKIRPGKNNYATVARSFDSEVWWLPISR